MGAVSWHLREAPGEAGPQALDLVLHLNSKMAEGARASLRLGWTQGSAAAAAQLDGGHAEGWSSPRGD